MPLVITGFEQLSSSICCRVMASQNLAWKGKLRFFWKVRNFAKNWVFGPYFWPQMCYEVNEGLCRRGFSPSFQQNFEPKEWVNALGPRAGQRWQKIPKHVLFV